MISRRRFDGLFCQGTQMRGRSGSCWSDFVVVHRRGSLIAQQPLRWRLELDHQPIVMDFDPDYLGGDEVSIVSGCRLLEMLADGTCDER